MKVEYIERKTLLDFEQEIGREITVKEFEKKGEVWFTAELQGGVVRDGETLKGMASARGATVDEALKSLAVMLSGNTLSFRDGPFKVEFKVPLLYTNIYN